MHWGAFQLTDEPISEPIGRMRAWWERHGPRDGRSLAEMAVGEIVHIVLAPASFQHEGTEHRVVDRRDLDAVAREDQRVVFDVLADLEDRRVFQHGGQQIERFLA